MNQKINILFLDHQSEMGGAEVALLEIIKALDRSKFNPIIRLGELGNFKDELEKLNVDVGLLDIPECYRTLKRDPLRENPLSSFVKSVFVFPELIWKTSEIIKRNNAEIVFFNTVKSAIFGIPAARRAKARTIWMIHDCLTEDFYKKGALRILALLARDVDKIICNSKKTRDAFLKLTGKRAGSKTVVVNNGVDLKKFNPDIRGEGVKKELSFKGERAVTLVGRFEPWKGQKTFIEAADIALKKDSNLKFIMTGGPLFGREEYEKECRVLVKRKGLEDKILFLGFRDDVPEIIAASDVIVHASILPEPFGRDIVEAMACGKPVISTNIGGPYEIITPDTGVFVEPGDPVMLAEEIIKLSDDPDRMSLLGKNARKRAEEKFDITKITEQIEDVIKKETAKGGLRVAIVHDYLVADAGAEKVLRALMEIFPEAPVFTLFYNEDKFEDLKERDIRTSFMDKVPVIKEKHHLFLPLYPLGILSLNLKGYDVILSSSWAWSKGLRKPSKAYAFC